MEKLAKPLFLFFIWAFSTNAIAQDIIKPGLVRAQLTISPSYNTSVSTGYFYLHGNAAVYLEKKISIAGEAYYYLGSTTPGKRHFDFNHSLFFGASYHFLKKNSDLFAGMQAGIAITRLDATENGLPATKTGFNPLISPVIGYNFYVNRVFHFFIHSRLVIGEHTYDLHKGLTEFRISAGLGFNI